MPSLKLRHRRRKTPDATRRRAFRPGFEPLEDRLAPAIFFVTTTADNGDDANPFFESLRHNILRANANPGPDEIRFALPASDPKHFYYPDDGLVGKVSPALRQQTSAFNDMGLAGVIDADHPHSWWSISVVGNPLPAIQGACLIDGWTQHGVSADPVNFPLFEKVPVIELEGSQAANVNNTGIGLRFRDTQGEVRGLIINRFPNAYIDGDGFDEDLAPAALPGTRIVGNFIGTDASGLIAADTSGAAKIRIFNTNRTAIGDAANPARFRNLVVSNGNEAVALHGNNNTVEANLVGVSRDGATRLGASGSVTLIGGFFNRITGNTVARNVTVGSITTLGEADFNSVLGNSIFGSTLGINLAGGFNLGRDINDFKDVDFVGYGNRGQNYPVLQSATYHTPTGVFTITGTLNTEPNKTVRLEFFANPDTSTGGEGRTFLGFVNATTDSNGDTGFVFPTTTWNRAMGAVITATATRFQSFLSSPHGATSEFSNPLTFVEPQVALTVAATTLPSQRVVASNELLEFTLTVTNTSTEPARSVEVFNLHRIGNDPIVAIGLSLPTATWHRLSDGFFVVEVPELAGGASMTMQVFAQLRPAWAPLLHAGIGARADNANLVDTSFDVPIFYPQIVLDVPTNQPILLPAGLSHELHFTARLENGGVPLTSLGIPPADIVDEAAFVNMTAESGGLSHVFRPGSSGDLGFAEFIILSNGIPGSEFIDVRTEFFEQGHLVELLEVFEIQWLNDVTVQLTPQTASKQVGLPQAFTVTVNKGGSAAADEEVVFNVTGANPTTATLTTNAQGQATFVHTGSTAGDDTITVTGRADNVLFGAQAQITWTPPPPAGDVRGNVYNDLNKNGQQDPGEPGIAGRQVYIDLNGNGRHDGGEPAATTGTDGVYHVQDVPVGTWTVNLAAQPTGWMPTAPFALGFREYILRAEETAVFDIELLAIDDVDDDGDSDIIVGQAIVQHFTPLFIPVPHLRQSVLFNNLDEGSDFVPGAPADEFIGVSPVLPHFPDPSVRRESTSLDADFNGDGALDVLYVRMAPEGVPALVIELYGTDGQPLGAPIIHTLATVPPDATFLAVAADDLNEDGILDVVGLTTPAIDDNGDELHTAVVGVARWAYPLVTVVDQQTTSAAPLGVTDVSVAPTDADGIADDIENGDGNQDGIPDSLQATVASLPNSVTDQKVSLATTAGYFGDVHATTSPSFADMPQGVQFPAGFFEFTVTGISPGSATIVTLYLPADTVVTTYYKYGREPADNPLTAINEATTNHWYEFLYDGTTGAETHAQNAAIPEGQILLHFVDGQRGDDDLQANGAIVDPGAPAFFRPAVNAAPEITHLANSGAQIGAVAQGAPVQISAAFTDANPGDVHSAVIDWGDGSSSAMSVTGSNGSGLALGSHVYAAGGVYTVTVTLSDAHGGAVTQVARVWITGAGVTGGVLRIVGTASSDEVTVSKHGKDQLKVEASFLAKKDPRKVEAARITRIEVYLGAGNDDATIANALAVRSLLDGGPGDDRLEGGGGPSILVGGDGDDFLRGMSGRDLLIGGRGADKLHGNGDQDILIAGFTAWDANVAALFAILDEWTRDDRTYKERVLALRQGGGANGAVTLNADPALGDVTVFDDDARDKLNGNAGRDWFLANLDGDGQRPQRDKTPCTKELRDDLE